MNDLFRMRQLIEEIEKADIAYFDQDAPILSDKEYDALVEELTALEKKTGLHFNNSPIGKVGGGIKQGLKTVEHTKPMLSCQKTKEMQDLLQFGLGHDLVCSWKMDGLTIVLRYKNGRLAQAITRGSDGLIGEDVTHNVQYFANIPLICPCKEDFEVRGEAVLSWEGFNIVTKTGDRSSHPRSVASGAVRSYTPDVGKLSHIDFVAFELIKEDSFATKREQLEFLEENNFEVVGYQFLDHTTEKEDFIQKIRQWNPQDFEYPVDGIVCEYDDIAYGKSLGATAHHERRMIALKWKDEVKETFFRGVELHTNRTGNVSIVGLFDAVELDGTKIRRANLHNLSNFERYQFGIGDLIRVYKANMIIPQIAENLDRSGTFELPEFCPSCGEKLTVRISAGGTKNLYCPNEECIARNAQRIARFCDKTALNIEGLSATTLEDMMARGWLRNYQDLFHLENFEQEILNAPGYGAQRYTDIIEAIEKARHCQMNRFLVGLGIPQLGPEAALALHQYYYGKMEDFVAALQKGFVFNRIEGISATLSQNLHQWYRESRNQQMLHALMAELDFIGQGHGKKKSNPFCDKILAVTGTFERVDRKELYALLSALGATITESVNEKTDYLIYGALPGSKKIAKAMKLGTPMLGEAALAELLEQNL